jgi:hypothetical protein
MNPLTLSQSEQARTEAVSRDLAMVAMVTDWAAAEAARPGTRARLRELIARVRHNHRECLAIIRALEAVA